ncbi:MAG: hypothetical protein ABI746_05735 [Dermatophilaceae bacterium]
MLLAVIALAGCAAPLSTSDAAPQRFIEAPAVSEAARQRYGDGAQQAYEELTRFSMDQWLLAKLVDPGAPAPTAQALSDGITEHLAPATVPSWQQSVTAALAGNADQANLVRILRFYDLQAPTLRMPDGGSSPITGESITQGTVGLGAARSDGIVPLVVAFRQGARLNLLSGRSPFAVDLKKDLVLTVVPADELAKVAAATPSVAQPTTSGATTGASIARDSRVTWLISTFEGDIASSDRSSISSGSETPSAPSS